jgi:hypothetical protein
VSEDVDPIIDAHRCRQLWASVLLDCLEPASASCGEPGGTGFLTDETGGWAQSRRLICDAAGIDHDAFMEAVKRRRSGQQRAPEPEPSLADTVLHHVRSSDGRITAPDIATVLGRTVAGVASVLRSLEARGLVYRSDTQGWWTEPPATTALRRGCAQRLLDVLSVGEELTLSAIQQRADLTERQARAAIDAARRHGHIFVNTAPRTFRRDR